MKKYSLVVFLIALFTFPIRVNAVCSYKDQVRLQKIAGNVTFSYRYIESKYNVQFQITVSNLTSELYMIDTSTMKTYFSDNQDFVIDGYESGKTIRFDFYAKDSGCTPNRLFSSYVTLPSYNPYHTNRLCEGIEDFTLCQKWLKNQMTYKEFYEGIMNYKKETVIEPPAEEKKEEFDWEIVVQFWADYYIYILVAVIIISIYGMYRYDKKTDL